MTPLNQKDKEIKEKIIEILEGKTIDILKEADKRGGLDNKEYQKIQTDQILSLIGGEKQKERKEFALAYSKLLTERTKEK